MNEEFALDPALGSRVQQLRFLLSKFGYYEGRFAARFPKAWFRDAVEQIQDDSIRAALAALWERYGDLTFLASGRPYDPKQKWLENATSQHLSRPFAQVISAERHEGTTALDDLELDALPGSRDARKPGSVDNLLDVMSPLIRTSGTLYLIDPYFVPWAHHVKWLFTAVVEQAFNARCVSLTAFVSVGSWSEYLHDGEERIEKTLPRRWGGRKRVDVKVCNDVGSDMKLHARYLFSERGGIRLDKGLQTQRAVVDISYIDRGVHEDLMKTFVERPLPFEVVRHFAFTT